MPSSNTRFTSVLPSHLYLIKNVEDTRNVFSILKAFFSICVNTIFPLTKTYLPHTRISALEKAVELPCGMIHLYIGFLAVLDKDGHCFFERTNI